MSHPAYLTLTLHDALPISGSILDIALANGVEIDHVCGGVCACSTCYCIVREGSESLSEMSDGEEDELRSEEHTSELQSHHDLVCRLMLVKKNTNVITVFSL